MRSRALHGGFTLVELSVVLVVIALVTAMSVTSGLNALQEAKRTQTEKKMDTIEAALLAYRTDNKRLPCPADPTITDANPNVGKDTATAGDCITGTSNIGTAGNVAEGAVPVQTLNLPHDYMYDGWGHRFAYAVDTNATEYRAFDTINISDSCGITVNDSAGAHRADPNGVTDGATYDSGAVYALVSFGLDGHGSFLGGGTRMSSGSTDTDEQKNCHCGSNGVAGAYDATYVQKDNTSSFDDIVHYKSRWQLISYDDQYGLTYNGPQVIAGFSGAATTSYKMQCGRLKQQSTLVSDAASVTFLSSVETGKTNGYALVYYSSGPCKVYALNGDGTITASSTNLNLTCPTYNSGLKVIASPNGYLAITDNASPYIHVWKQSSADDTFTQLPFVTVGSVVTTSPISFQPTSISISNNYLVLSNSTNMKAFMLTGSSVTPVTVPSLPASPYYGAAISANGYYLALVTLSSNHPQIYLWTLNSGSPTAASTFPFSFGTITDTAPSGLVFSPDGQYLAFNGDGTNNNVIVAHLNPLVNSASTLDTSGITLTGLPAASGSNKATALAFSPDDIYITMATPNTTANSSPVMLRQTSSNTYKLASSPDSSPAAACTAVSYNH